MPVPSFVDSGTWNLRDVGLNKLVAKVHVEPTAADAAGGRAYVIHWAIAKVDPNEAGWAAWIKPTAQDQRSWKWESTGESLAQFVTWMHDAGRKGKLRYMAQGTREQEGIP